MADQLTGAPSDLVYADASCSGNVGLLRGWALALPAAAVWWLARPLPLPQAG